MAQRAKFERYPTTNINPVLISERGNATFNVKRVTNLLDGGEYITKLRQKIEAHVLQDLSFMDDVDYNFLSRSERYEAAVRKEGLAQQKLQQLGLNNPAAKFFYGSLVHPNEISPTVLHEGAFKVTINAQGTPEQSQKWTSDSQIFGTYVQTELGHGTHVRGLETTATYDPITEEFVLNSPTLTSTKWWPGGLGRTCNYAIVMALLYTGGKCYGAHPFVVPLRDLKTHKALSGIVLGDIGPKFGFDTIDNGYVRFDKVRIPRTNLLMKNQEVQKDGTYVRKVQNEKLGYGSMIFIRAMVVLNQAAKPLAQAVTIAIRYSCIRHQSELKPGGPEPQVIEFKTQQYRLLPLLASAYAFYFAGLKIRDMYFDVTSKIGQGETESLPELHAISCGLKALSTSTAMLGIEQCRLACGGHGYSLASGIPKIYVAATAACTYEGENTVLFLQTARYLVKMFQQKQTNISADAASYLNDDKNTKLSLDDSLNSFALIDAYRHRAARLVAGAVARISKLQSEGREYYEAWNLTSVDLVKAAQAHCLVYVCEAFNEVISMESDINVSRVLKQLFQLFACYVISESPGDFIEDGYINGEQLELIRNSVHRLMEEIRPNIISLTDAFDFTDRLLGSALGCYDGNVYEKLFKWASASPLNKSDVHQTIKYIRPDIQAKL